MARKSTIAFLCGGLLASTLACVSTETRPADPAPRVAPRPVRPAAPREAKPVEAEPSSSVDRPGGAWWLRPRRIDRARSPAGEAETASTPTAVSPSDRGADDGLPGGDRARSQSTIGRPEPRAAFAGRDD